jgi:DNA-binding HxlR family transcriptional regulator
MAKRMGLSRRTIERQLRQLCDLGLVQKMRLNQIEDIDGNPRVGYDLSGLVASLEGLPVETKSPRLARRIDALASSQDR